MDIGLWWFDNLVLYEILDIIMEMYALIGLMTQVLVIGTVFASIMFWAEWRVRWIHLQGLEMPLVG